MIYQPVSHHVDLNVQLMCPDCKKMPPNIVEDFSAGDVVCGDCGLVLEERIIDTRRKWPTFANSGRVDITLVASAANPLSDGPQLDSIISQKDSVSSASRDLKKVHRRSAAVKGKCKLVQAYKDISAMCEAIGLPKLLVDTAKQIYKRVENEKLLRGNPTESVIAACIFIACRHGKVSRTFNEICAFTQVPKKEIGRCFKALVRVLGNNVNAGSSETSSEAQISRFCSTLNLPMDVRNAVVELTRRAKELGPMARKAPISIVAACIYFVANLYKTPKTTKQIGVVCGVSEITIKNTYKYLYQERTKLLQGVQFKHLDAIESLPTR